MIGTRRTRLLAVALLPLCLAAACGDGGTDSALPRAASAAFGPDVLHDLQLPGDATQVGDTVTRPDGTATATYAVPDDDPARTLEAFTVPLVAAGWVYRQTTTLEGDHWVTSVGKGDTTISFSALPDRPAPTGGAETSETTTYVTVTVTGA